MIMKMTPEKQRIAIAEACGHKNIAKHIVCEGTGMDFEDWYSGVPAKGGYAIPDYLSDLDAMHEAEKVLLSQSMINRHKTPFHRYHLELHRICTMPDNTFDLPMKAEHWAICATAAQRSEAFLRTLGLWKE